MIGGEEKTARRRQKARERYAHLKQDPAWWVKKQAENRASHARNKDGQKERRKERWHQNKVSEKLRAKGLDRSLVDIIEAHSGLCDICGEPPSGGRWPSLCIDHDHTTGEFRGMLCSRCNRGIGQFRDDPDLLKAAAEYLWKRRMDV